jgi:hypothetical protein
MSLPSILQDHSWKHLIQGAAVGAVVTMIVGFNWGGWSLESTAAQRADESSRSAVIAVLAPICVADHVRAYHCGLVPSGIVVRQIDGHVA